jgi:uncharacterized protein (DUF1697 family)
MTAYVALLRAVNVGGTGTLTMPMLAELCRGCGFDDVKTYAVSGNVVFRSAEPEAAVRGVLHHRLQAMAGKPIGVLVRSAGEMADVLVRNPFPGAAFHHVVALFTDDLLPLGPLCGAAGRCDEQIRLGKRELFVFYPGGTARTRLRLPAGAMGTARNLNTVGKLAAMAAALG